MNPRPAPAVPRMSMRLAAVLVAGVSIGLAACSAPEEAPATAEPLPGSDRDAHGCIPSAGYAWCERSGQCERPWELAAQEGFEDSAEGFEQYCATAGEGDTTGG